jgi:hypothetical protein
MATLGNGRAVGLTERELEEAEALCAAATPGPWTKFRLNPRPSPRHRAFLCTLFVRGQWLFHRVTDPGLLEADADFIAAARGLVPRLLAEVRRLRGPADVRPQRRRPARPPTCPTWEDLVTLEPALAALLDEARAYRADTGPDFCANAVFYAGGGLKERLCRLVGWDRMPHPVLGTPAAYDVAYDTVYDALPDCRGRCCCL